MKIRHTAALAAGLFALLLAGGACDYDDDDDYDRPVPPGMGTLMIDNETYDHISVFIDGVYQEQIAREDRVTAYDLPPGLYRVALEQRGGHGSFRDDIDVLPGQRTVIEVWENYYDESWFSTRVFFD